MQNKEENDEAKFKKERKKSFDEKFIFNKAFLMSVLMTDMANYLKMPCISG
jgi:hypothetical protein